MVRTKIRGWALLALLIAAIPGLIAPVSASAGSSGAQVIADCQAHQRLTRQYTVAQLKNALATLPADIQEYSNCEQVIEAALTHAGGKGANNGAGHSTSSSSSFLPTPVIVILVLLVLAAVTFGAISVRRRSGGPGPEHRS